MGIQQGSLSLCRYRVLRTTEGGASHQRASLAQLNDLLEPYKAEPVQLGDFSTLKKEEIVGWVRPIGIDRLDLDPDAHWDLSHAQVGDGFLLRLRAERRKVPPALAQLVFKQKFAAEEQKTGKPPGPKRRKELREETKTSLMARALPNLAYVDGYWRDTSGDLYVYATGKKAREIFEALFMQTFGEKLGLTLLRLDPPLIGLARDAFSEPELAESALSRLSLTAPTALANAETRTRLGTSVGDALKEPASA